MVSVISMVSVVILLPSSPMHHPSPSREFLLPLTIISRQMTGWSCFCVLWQNSHVCKWFQDKEQKRSNCLLLLILLVFLFFFVLLVFLFYSCCCWCVFPQFGCCLWAVLVEIEFSYGRYSLQLLELGILVECLLLLLVPLLGLCWPPP